MANLIEILGKLNQVSGIASSLSGALAAPKPGASTTEFWLSTLGAIAVNFLPAIPITTSAPIAAALIAVYTLARAGVKIAHTLAQAGILKHDVPDLPDLGGVTDALNKLASSAQPAK
jgi:hypothetical protein